MAEDKRLVPYQPLDLDEPAELVTAIRKRRGGQLRSEEHTSELQSH